MYLFYQLFKCRHIITNTKHNKSRSCATVRYIGVSCLIICLLVKLCYPETETPFIILCKR